MGKATNKSLLSALAPKGFGNFTRERLTEMLRMLAQESPDAAVVMAATCLASLDPHGPNPSPTFITAAMDVLARARTRIADDLLWQAAEHAANWRIRVAAVERSGPVAPSIERHQALRTWASDGFNPGASFQNDQFSMDIAKAAAVSALGHVPNPNADDLDTLIKEMAGPSHRNTSSQQVFSAASEAYWNVGSPDSLPKLLGLLSNGYDDEETLTIISLAAKFSARQLKPHAATLRTVLHNHAQRWQENKIRDERLTALVEKMANEEFLRQWSSSYGGDGMVQGRGRITNSMLKTLGQPTEGVTKALLILAQWAINAQDSSFTQSLRVAAAAGNGKLIASTIIDQRHEGHRHLVESGMLFSFYPSIREALATLSEAIGLRTDVHEQRRAATGAAVGLILAGLQNVKPPRKASEDAELLKARGRRQHRQTDQEELAQCVEGLQSLPPDQNPVMMVARFACPPASSPGAAVLIEEWLRPEDALSRYVMRSLISDASHIAGDLNHLPMLKRLEQFLLLPQGQMPPLRQPLEQALIAEVVVDGRLNRYALDLMGRENLAFERGADLALSALQQQEDADFLLSQLAGKGISGLNILTRAIEFHRDGDEKLTAHVQAKAIASSTDLVRQAGDAARIEALAKQLHMRFQDLPVVRESAYRACGELRHFGSIKPLRDRLQKERGHAPQTAIVKALTTLRESLMRSKPEQGKPEKIRDWLRYVADLADPELLPQVVGYLRPPHNDHSVRRAALLAVENMKDPQALEIVKWFVENTAPEGETLAVARRTRMVLEQRHDVDLFDAMAAFFEPESEVLDPATDYEQLLGGYVLSSVTRSLRKAQKLWQDGHWDEYITQTNGILEVMVRHVFRTKYAVMGLDQPAAERLAGGNSYANMLNTTQFRTTHGKLQAHCNTIQSFRRDSPTAHAMNKDGTPKLEATPDEAAYVRREFLPAFTEAVRALK